MNDVSVFSTPMEQMAVMAVELLRAEGIHPLQEHRKEHKGDTHMDETTVYQTWDESMAEMAVDLLRTEGIEARKLSAVPRSVLPFTMDGLGEILVVVPDIYRQEALDILAARFSEGEIVESGEEETEDEGESGDHYDREHIPDEYRSLDEDE
jgi:hypothetical protein